MLSNISSPFNIKFSKKTKNVNNNTYTNIYFYDNSSSLPLQKFSIRLDNITIIDMYNNSNDICAVKFLLSPLRSSLEEKINFIKNLEDYIIKKLSTDYPSVKFKKNFRDSNDYYPSIISNIPSIKKGKNYIHDTNTYDIFQNKIPFSDVKCYSKISSIIEFNSVWIKNNEIGGFSWDVICLKLYPTISLDYSLFDLNETDYKIINNFNNLSDIIDDINVTLYAIIQ